MCSGPVQSNSSVHSLVLCLSSRSLCATWRLGICSSFPGKLRSGDVNSWSGLYQGQLPLFEPGARRTRGQRCNWNPPTTNCDHWGFTHANKVFRMDMSFWKKNVHCVYSFYWLSIDLCWLLTLGTFWGRTGEGRMIVPLYYWNSVLLRPDESFCTCLFLLVLFPVCLFDFPSVGEV